MIPPQDRSAELRSHLRSAVAASAGPYGYTLTIFATGSVASYVIGRPHVFELLLFIAGAVAAFLLVEAVAFGSPRAHLKPGEAGPVEAWGQAHLVSAGLAIFLSWAALQAVSSNVGWAVAGFVSTATYLMLNAVQSLLAAAAGR
jgi:hypothetical protein